MNETQLTHSLIKTRELEIANYLEFLKIATESQANITAKSGNDSLSLSLNKDLTHTLKANVLLLLYSAMEATLIQLLDEMYEVIGGNCNSTDELNEALLDLAVATFKETKNQSQTITSPIHKSIFQSWMTDWKGRKKAKDKRVGGISGSVDGLIFFRQLKKFGVLSKQCERPPDHLSHHSLQKVKNRRNELAHGESSFIDLGRDLSLQELIEDTRCVFQTLIEITAEVDRFLKNRSYLAAPATLNSEVKEL